MKKILLIGDSIRKGYDTYVRESFDKTAEVCFPEENTMFTTYILRYLHSWVEKLNAHDAALVHFNAGLWDSLRIYDDEPLVKLDTYKDNIERIIKRIMFLCPKAKIVFATSTPCIEEDFIQGFEIRYNKDVELYNDAAMEVCNKYDVIVNDLYSLLKNRQELHSDQTHYYTADGTELIGNQVNQIICDAVGIDKTQLITPDKNKYESKKEGASDKDIYVKRGDYYEVVQGV